MPRDRVSVVGAAEILGVHPQRIHQRIREGSLVAEKVGNQWVVEVKDLRRIRHHRRPGRPLSTRSAWDLLAVAAGDGVVSRLSPSARSRARSRLGALIVEVASADLDDAAAALGHALRNRAERVSFLASPRDLPDLRGDLGVHLSGASLPQSNLSAGDLVEGYVAADVLDAIVEDYLLGRVPSSRANVIFHVAPSSGHPALEDLGSVVRSPLALAADLTEHDGVRERSEAIRSVAELRGRFDTVGDPVNGADRG